jgi:HK97 family phage portal protein
MSLIRRGLETRSDYPAFNAMVNPLNLYYGQVSMSSLAGERVDEVTALGVASVLSCVGLLADSVAMMDLIAYDEATGERVDLPQALTDPDPQESTSYEFKHSTIATTAMHGNSYTFLSRDRRGEVIGLTPLHPYQMTVQASKNYTGRAYLHLGREIPREDLLVMRWYTPPQALIGISPLSMQRTMIGLAMAMDRYLAQWYANGATPSSVLETDQGLTKEAMISLREQWEASQRKARRPAVLSNGIRWRQVQTSAVDMEFNATREAVLAEVARIFRIPMWLIGMKGDPSTYQNVEQASLAFLIHTLQPWLTRFEIALSSIFPGVTIKFDPSTLLRLDSMTKARVQTMQISAGVRSRNEARADDGFAPYPGGDDFVTVLPGSPVGPDQVVGVDPLPNDPPVDNG